MLGGGVEIMFLLGKGGRLFLGCRENGKVFFFGGVAQLVVWGVAHTLPHLHNGYLLPTYFNKFFACVYNYLFMTHVHHITESIGTPDFKRT